MADIVGHMDLIIEDAEALLNVSRGARTREDRERLLRRIKMHAEDTKEAAARMDKEMRRIQHAMVGER